MEPSENKKIPTAFHVFVSVHYPGVNRTIHFYLRVGKY